jgi:hypothetical protein
MKDGKYNDRLVRWYIKNGIGESSNQSLPNIAVNKRKYLRVTTDHLEAGIHAAHEVGSETRFAFLQPLVGFS